MITEKLISLAPVNLALLKTARDQAIRVCVFSMYADLINFFKNIERNLVEQGVLDALDKITQDLDALYLSMRTCVVNQCAGFAIQESRHGCAVYLPFFIIDSSYAQTRFAMETRWLSLLNLLIL